MGYCVSMDINVTFKDDDEMIKREDVERILDMLGDSFKLSDLRHAISEQFASVEERILETFNKDLSSGFSWVDAGDWCTLNDALGAWRYIRYNDNSIEFEGEKLGDDEKMWRLIAPYIKEGSYIEVAGEDGDVWRWFFDGVTLSEQRPTWG